MKKIIALVLALIMVLSLAACGECKHETWNSPDCVTPATCAECGITEGEALGHSFAEATCAAPETCYICGETQGEALPHTYGAWEIGSSDMSRVCTECGYADTQPLDYEVAVKALMAGPWEYSSAVFNGQVSDNTPYDETPDTYMVCSDDGSGTLCVPMPKVNDDATDFYIASIDETPFSISDVQYVSELDCYNFTMNFSDSTVAFGQVVLDDSGDYQFTYMVDMNNYMLFNKNLKERNSFTGTWVATENGEFKTLILNEDGSLGGDYTGTWHPKFLIASNGAWYSGFSTIYEDGENYAYSDGLTYICSQGDDLDEWLKYNSTITLYNGIGNSWNFFDKISQENYDALKAAHEEGKELVVGTWTTDEANTYNNSGEALGFPGEYSLVFNADGTLNATLMDTMDGTWCYRGAEMNGNDINYIIDYVLGDDESYFRIMRDGNLLASSMRASDGEYYSYTMEKN